MVGYLIINIRDIHHGENVIVEIVLKDASDDVKREVVAKEEEDFCSAREAICALMRVPCMTQM